MTTVLASRNQTQSRTRISIPIASNRNDGGGISSSLSSMMIRSNRFASAPTAKHPYRQMRDLALKTAHSICKRCVWIATVPISRGYYHNQNRRLGRSSDFRRYPPPAPSQGPSTLVAFLQASFPVTAAGPQRICTVFPILQISHTLT